MKKKFLFVVLFVCLFCLPMFVSASDVTSKYKTMNLKETFEDEGMTISDESYKETDDQITIYMFRGKGCAYCKKFLEFLNKNLKEYGKYFKVVSFETWYDEDNSNLLNEIATFKEQTASGVPFILIGDQYFPGYVDTWDESILSAITTTYNAEEKYDVFDDYEKTQKQEARQAALSKWGPIFVNFVVVVAAAVVVIFINKKNTEAILTAVKGSNKKVASEVVKVENEDKPVKTKTVKKSKK